MNKLTESSYKVQSQTIKQSFNIKPKDGASFVINPNATTGNSVSRMSIINRQLANIQSVQTSKPKVTFSHFSTGERRIDNTVNFNQVHDRHILIEQNPSIYPRRPTVTFNHKYNPSLALPVIPLRQDFPQKRQGNTIKLIQKNQQTEQSVKDKVCKFLPWILVGLLLIGLIIMSILFALNNRHNQTYQTSPSDSQMIPKSVTRQPCRKQYMTINRIRQKDCITQDNINSDDRIIDENTHSYSEYELFDQVDHTNYRYVHLRQVNE